MRLKTPLSLRRLSLRLVVLFIIFTFISGVAFASFTLGSFTNVFSEGGATLAPSPPTGVSFASAGSNLALLTSPSSATKCTSTDSSTSTTPSNLVSGSTTWGCVNSIAVTGYLAADALEYATVTWSTSAPVSATYELSVFFGGATGSPLNIFVKTPATLSSSASEIVTFDLIAGGITSVTSLDVLVHQCAGTTCP